MVWSVTINGKRVAVADWVSARTPLPCACGTCDQAWVLDHWVSPTAAAIKESANRHGWVAELDPNRMLVHVTLCSPQADRIIAALEAKPLLMEQVCLILERRRRLARERSRDQ